MLGYLFSGIPIQVLQHQIKNIKAKLMKNLKFINLFIVSGILVFSSCNTEDKLIDELDATVERGAVLRTKSVSGNTCNVLDTSSTWSVLLEEQDAEGGALFQEIKLYGNFVDNTPDGGTTNVPEALIKTIPASSFSTDGSPFGLPRGTVSTTFQEVLDALGLVSGQYDGGDQIILRLELVLTDGRTYTNDAGGTVSGGSFFTSPFQYTNLLICLGAPPAGDYTVSMHDSYGDGWQTDDPNGGSGITVTLNDGTVIEVGLCTPYIPNTYACTANLSNGTATVTIPVGTLSADWYFPGDVYGEISAEIFGPSGNQIGAIPQGSSAGPIALNLCNE